MAAGERGRLLVENVADVVGVVVLLLGQLLHGGRREDQRVVGGGRGHGVGASRAAGLCALLVVGQ